MSASEDQAFLEEELNSFDRAARQGALERLVRLAGTGGIRLHQPKSEVNLHFHTFFSFNARGWSPSRIAWESRKYGLEVAGIVDFDVLDGMEEFLSAGELVGQKAVVGLETRVFIKELSDKVINSPNEPGIAYFMASGCCRRPTEGSGAERTLTRMRETARVRNLEVVRRVNDYLEDVRLDYERDAVPLTPAGNVTERHLLLAYDRKAREVFGTDSEAAGFWSGKLGMPKPQVERLMGDAPNFHEVLRGNLMKYGSVGYVQPDAGSFPSVEEAVSMIRGMDAIPTATWLDGTNPGEADAMSLLELMQSKGAEAVNIIPDRNWNIPDPKEKARKLAKLREIVETCRELRLPIIVGTEMNKAGQPFVDDFAAPELLPFVEDFLAGAKWVHERTTSR